MTTSKNHLKSDGLGGTVFEFPRVVKRPVPEPETEAPKAQEPAQEPVREPVQESVQTPDLIDYIPDCAEAEAELDALIERAESVTLQDYQELLTDIAKLTESGALDSVQREAIIQAMVSNKGLGCGKRALNNALKAAEKKIAQDNAETGKGVVRGGRGTYVIRDGWLCRKTEEGLATVCSALHVIGLTRNTEQANWGVMLEWRDREGKTHTWAMPKRLAMGDGRDAIATLLDRGLVILGGTDKYIIDYLHASSHDRLLTCVDKTGWYNGKVFVTPSKVFGDSSYDDSVVYQGPISAHDAKSAGTLDGWKQHVAKLAINNSRLMFAISSAFAPALLDIAPNVGNGGFHLTGNSKDGKTLVALAAASVHGYHRDIKQQWRGTINGIEALAALHNHSWLFLDELGMASAQEIERVIYMLAEGKNKARQTRDNDLKRRVEWRMIWFSTGEVSATDHIASKDGAVPAGIELRQADIPSDAGKGYKVHDCIHDYPDVNAFNAAIGEGIESQYGTAGAAWLTALANNRGELDNSIPQRLDDAAKTIGGEISNTQTRDVLYRFALVAVAGELASEYGITGWDAGCATYAAKRVYTDWLMAFGGDETNREHRRIVDAVKSFLLGNMSRFVNMKLQTPIEELQRVHDCVGGVIPAYNDEKTATYLVFNSQLGKLAPGYSKQQIRDALVQAGMIEANAQPKRERIPGYGQPWVTRVIIND